MNITVNGTSVTETAPVTVERLVDSRSLPTRGIAIAVNGQVVRAAEWPAHDLVEGDVVDIVTARQGG